MNFDELKTWALLDFHDVLTLAFMDCTPGGIPFGKASDIADRYVHAFETADLPELSKLRDSYLSSNQTPSQESKIHEEIVRILVNNFCRATNGTPFEYFWSFYETKVSHRPYYSKELIWTIIEKALPFSTELAPQRELLIDVINTPMDENGGLYLDSMEAVEVMQKLQTFISRFNKIISENVAKSNVSIHIFDRILEELDDYLDENPNLEDNCYVIAAAVNFYKDYLTRQTA